ncbi:MAG: IgGFc-binding protein [Myxococcales bacterium]
MVAPTYDVPAFFSVVAPQDNTRVTIKFSAATLASANGTFVGAQVKNSTATYLLNRHDVLQFWSGPDGATPAECYTFPSGSSWSKVCRYNSDPTGTLVTAVDANDPNQERPVAVFSGADCSFKPYDKFACDHLEEMMLPVSSWGSFYAGVKSVPYKQQSGAPVASPSPDYYRVVASCTKAECPLGTTVTITPAPSKYTFPSYPVAIVCSSGVCILPPIDAASSTPTAAWVEFTQAQGFTVSANHKVMLSQYFTGEGANTGAIEGDPSLVLVPPVEQWRKSYNLLASPTFVHNYLSLVTRSAAPQIQIDGKAIATFSPTQETIGGSSPYYVFKVPVTGGSHLVTAQADLGATVYGYDSYVSYGYTGGLSFASGAAFHESKCSDQVDNDHDSSTDCADSDCDGQACGSGCLCQSGTKTEAACDDQVDNDGNAKVDCADGSCQGASCGIGCACNALARSETLCADGADNDGDGKKDCGDSDCAGKTCTKANGLAGVCVNGTCG